MNRCQSHNADAHALFTRLRQALSYMLELGPGRVREAWPLRTQGPISHAQKPDVRLRWAVLVAQGSQAFAEKALAAKERGASWGSNRMADIEKELEKQGLPRWDTQFRAGKVREAAASRAGYTPGINGHIRNRTDNDIITSMLEMPGAGPFYAQHALVLMTNFGSIKTAKDQGILDLNGAWIIGDGALPILHLFLSEFLGFQVEEGLRGQDLHTFAIAERERWLVVALAHDVPPIPTLKNNQRGDWVKLMECLGDVLCESRKCLRHLAGLKQLRASPASGWKPKSRQPRAGGSGGGGHKRKRGS